MHKSKDNRSPIFKAIGGAQPSPPLPLPPPPPSAAARADQRRRETDASNRVAYFVKPHIETIASEADDTVGAILALSDEKVLSGLHELNCRIRTAKAHLRRFFRAVGHYHSTIRVRIDQLRRTSQSDLCYPLLIKAHVKSHAEIGTAIERILRAWSTACRRMRQVVREPFLLETVRNESTCIEFTEFIEALSQRHESMEDEMEDALLK